MYSKEGNFEQSDVVLVFSSRILPLVFTSANQGAMQSELAGRLWEEAARDFPIQQQSSHRKKNVST